MRCQPDGGQRHFGVREVRRSLTADSAAPPCVLGFVLTVCAGSPSRCRVLSPFPCLSRGRRARLGRGRPCAHATMARMVHTKKWPHVWRDRRERSVVRSSGEAQALRRGSGARRGRTNPARGWIRTAASIEGVRKWGWGEELQVIMQTG